LERGESPTLLVALIVWDDGGPTGSLTTGESHILTSQSGVRKTARSKVRARVIGSNSLGWVEVLEGWGAEIEAVVVSSLDCYSHIRALVTTTPTGALDLAYLLPPCGPWDGCLAANIITTEDARVISVLFKRWLPAVGILSIPGALSRSKTLRLLPVGLPSFYQKKIITVHHPGVGGATSTTWGFVVYS
jgi:hypothetical protein